MVKRLLFLGMWLPLLLPPLGASPAAGVSFTKLIIDPNPGNIPVEKLMADLNGDGKLDIIVGLEQAGLYWWQFPASGRITDPWPKHTIKSDGNFYEDLQPCDLNGDGHLDIIACHDNNMYWYQNPGGDASGTWTEHFLGNGLGHDVRLADIDGDGKVDVVTQYGIYFQNNADSWTYKGLGSLKGMALLDIGSGKGAINIVLNTANGVTWYENPRETGGNARTGNWVSHLVDSSTGAEEQPLAAGFISNDGKMHLLGNPPNQGLVWWQAPNDRRNGSWTKHVINGSYQDIHKIVLADMDKNGTQDLVVAEQEQSHDPAGGPYTFNNDRVAVFYNDGAGNFTEQVLETTGGQNNVVGDVDGDGDLDILNVNHGFYGAPHPIELFVINLSGGAPPPPPPPPPPSGSGGSLSGSTGGAASGYNLTSLGTADWVHWGRGGSYGNLDRKSSGGNQISGVSVVGAGANNGGWSDSSRSVSWTDGTPTGSLSNDHGYIWSNGSLGSGFSFTVPADTSNRTLMVYFGASDATCTLSAHLSDNSASDYSTAQTGPGAWFATLNYHAGSSGQSLTVTLLKTGNNSGFTDGSADLDAAALQGSGGGTPPPPGGGTTGNGTGLRGDYFDNIDFSNQKLSRTDPTVNFDWGGGSPDPSMGSDQFSVRWTGQVQAQFSETYTFYTDSDDGIRLWVNGTQVINNWTDHAPTEDAGSISLSAGQKVDIKIEYYENGGGAVAKLLWSSPSTSKQVVPSSQLYPAAGGGSPPPGGSGGSLSGSAGGAAAGYNLTSLGTADWVHWGRGGSYCNLDRKASGCNQISSVSIVGSGANNGGWSDSSRSVSWTDGTPTGSLSNDHGYIWSNGSLGTGFQFSVPADTSSRTLSVYFGASNATCTLSAHLSDGSTPDYSSSQTGPGAWFATLTYQAGSGGQSLTVTLLKTGNNSGFTDGSADLDAAALQGGGTASAPAAPPPSSGNLAHNPGFESDPSVDYFPYGSATFSWATDAAHGGTHSVKIVSVQPSGTLTRWLSNTTSVGATAGKTYTASAWFKTLNASDHGVITINFWNSASQVLAGMDGGTINGSTDWTQLTVSGTAPAGTAFIRVEFRLWGGGTLWADDVILSQN